MDTGCINTSKGCQHCTGTNKAEIRTAGLCFSSLAVKCDFCYLPVCLSVIWSLSEPHGLAAHCCTRKKRLCKAEYLLLLNSVQSCPAQLVLPSTIGDSGGAEG